MSYSVIPSYIVQANLEIGEVTAVLDTSNPVSLLSEMCISTNVCLEPYLGDSLFQGINQILINILGLLKQRVKVRNCHQLSCRPSNDYVNVYEDETLLHRTISRYSLVR